MTKTRNATKIAAIVLTFVMLLSTICIAGTATAGAATDKVQMCSAGVVFTKYGNSDYEVFIKTNDNARNQKVMVHYHYLGGAWNDVYAECVQTNNDGSKIWKARFYSYALKYAIRYEGDGVSTWDNNNGKDYTYTDVLGRGAAVTSERLGYAYDLSNYQINAVLQNYAYHKNVFVRYTTDGWRTYQDKALGYVKTNENGTETWSTRVNAQGSDFQYAICYRVNGSEYWANNYDGSNYNLSYCIHR